MKKILAVCLMVFAGTIAFADTPIAPTALPAKVQSFIAETFPDSAVTYAEADWSEYEVHLDDGTEITFRKNGDWKDIKSYNGVPMSVLSNVISAQLDTMFPDVAIVEIEKERGNFEIKMANRMEVYFSANGKLIGQKYDD